MAKTTKPERKRIRGAKLAAHNKAQKALDAKVNERLAAVQRKLGKKADDLKVIRSCAELGATVREMAGILRVSRETMTLRLQEPDAALVYEAGLAAGMNMLRRMQWKNAKRGSATMQIWLGKNHLDQKEKSEITGAEGGPMIVEIVQFTKKDK